MRLQMVKMAISSINVEHAFINLSDGVELPKRYYDCTMKKERMIM
jgi:hypothetical protein